MSRRATIPIIIAATTAMGACTTVDPFVDFPQRHAAATSLAATAPLDQAIARLNSARDEMQCKAKEQSIIRSVSNGGILIGALTTLGFAAYGASKDAIIGGGLFTGASYALGAASAPRSYDTVYRAGIRALNCVDGAASPPAATIRAISGPASKLETELIGLRNAIVRGRQISLTTPRLSEALTAADAALTKGVQTRSVADRVLALEGPIAADVNRSIDTVVSSVNDQLSAQQPDAAATLAIAQSVPLVGLGVLKQAQDDALRLADEAKRQRGEIEKKSAAAAAAPVPDRNEALAREIENASARVLSAAEVIPQSMPISADTTRTALASCRVEEIAASPLMVSTSEIEIAAGEIYTFTVKGGKAPYSARFLGVRPDNVDIDSNGVGLFHVRGLTGLARGKEAVLDVTDASPGSPQHAEVRVKTR